MHSNFIFNDHSELKDRHALFSPSQSSWLRYDDEKIADRVRNQYRTALGTEIHDFAASQIDLNHKVTSVKELIREIENYIYCKYKYLSGDSTVSEYARKMIFRLSELPKEVFEAVKFYINDGIGFKMNTEQGLKYSEHIFGHADTICFRDNTLRIHDLKTGANPAHIEQLETYAALFCLEYQIKPGTINIQLRLYQWDGIVTHNPSVEDIVEIMDRIVSSEEIAQQVEKEG